MRTYECKEHAIAVAKRMIDRTGQQFYVQEVGTSGNFAIVDENGNYAEPLF